MLDQLASLCIYVPGADSGSCSGVLLPVPLDPPHLGTATLVVVDSAMAAFKCFRLLNLGDCLSWRSLFTGHLIESKLQ